MKTMIDFSILVDHRAATFVGGRNEAFTIAMKAAQEALRAQGFDIVNVTVSGRNPTKQENIALSPRKIHMYREPFEEKGEVMKYIAKAECKAVVRTRKTTKYWHGVTCSNCLKHAPKKNTQANLFEEGHV